MAKAKAKPRGANKYTPPTKSGAPGWIWLVAGILIGGFIMFLMKLEPKQDIRPGQKTTATTTKPKDKGVEFEFDKILSGRESATTQQPVLTKEQHAQLDGERASALLEGRKPPVLPPPVTQQSNQPAMNKPVQNAEPAAPTSKPAQTPTVTTPVAEQQVATVTPPSKMNFFLQVGSYPTKSGAESIRAQILMLGQDARLETTSANNKTWYRVLVGPYNSKDTATKAQNQLSSHGFSQTLVIPRKAQ